TIEMANRSGCATASMQQGQKGSMGYERSLVVVRGSHSRIGQPARGRVCARRAAARRRHPTTGRQAGGARRDHRAGGGGETRRGPARRPPAPPPAAPPHPRAPRRRPPAATTAPAAAAKPAGGGVTGTVSVAMVGNPQMKTLEQLKGDFESSHPGITLNLLVLP